jgi:hypothetical protein
LSHAFKKQFEQLKIVLNQQFILAGNSMKHGQKTTGQGGAGRL